MLQHERPIQHCFESQEGKHDSLFCFSTGTWLMQHGQAHVGAEGIEFQRLDLEGVVTARIALRYVKFAFFVLWTLAIVFFAIVSTVSVLR